MFKLNTIPAGLRDVFANEEVSFILQSAIEGFVDAEVYVDNPVNPSVYIIWDKGHFFCFGGESTDSLKLKEAVDFFKKKIIIEGAGEKLGAAKLYYASEKWESILLEGLYDFKTGGYSRTLFKHRLREIREPQKNYGDYYISEIDEKLINNNSVRNLNPMLSEIRSMWGTIEKFLKAGFGYCAIKDNSIISWCTSEYISRYSCGIGIETFEDYQGRGTATAAALNFVNRCRRDKLTPYWDCWTGNLPSVKTAEKVGFERVSDYKIVFVRFN